jgi:DNA-binding transcriptional LysR family regulator
MELRHLETFRTVVRAGSFLGAADELGCAQSTVTLHIQKLEATLGVRLFARQGRRARLTEAGETLHEHAARVLDQTAALEQAMADLTGGQGGQVRMGAIEPAAGLRLPAIIVPFCQRRPGVHLILEGGGTRSLSERVAAGELDFAICSAPAANLGLSFEPLFTETMVLLAPADHPLAVKEPLRAADLSGVQVVLSEPGCSYRQTVEGALLQRGALPVSGLEIGSVEALKRTVQRGLGVTILPENTVDPPPPGTIVRHVADLDLHIAVGIVRRPNGPPPGAALQALIAMVRSRLIDRG